MPRIAITENTAAQNGETVDSVFSGLEDTYIGEESPDFVYDGEAQLALGPSALEETKPMFRATGISNIPVGATINEAYLDIKSNVGFGTVLADVFALLEPWVKGEATWNNFATGSTWNTSGADGASDKAATPSNPSQVSITQNATWYRFNITSIVTNANGYIVEGTPPGDFRNFHRQTSADGDRPQVIADYTVAPAGPTLDSITGTISPGATVTLLTTDFGTITTATLGGQSLIINSSAGDSHSVTIPSDIALLWERTDLTLEVGDGTDTSALTNQTLALPTNARTAIFNGTVPDYATEESFHELVSVTQAFTAATGDQFQVVLSSSTFFDALTLNADTSFTLTPYEQITGTCAVFDVSTGTRSAEFGFSLDDGVLLIVDLTDNSLSFSVGVGI